MDREQLGLYFGLFNEIGILAQLSRAAFEARLPDGITVPHFSVLNHLVRLGDGKTPLAIARAFQVPKTSMTNTLAGLEGRGLVEMRQNPADGRSKCVYITPQGRKFRDQAIAGLAPEMQRLAEHIEPQVIARLLPDLAQIRAVMDTFRD